MQYRTRCDRIQCNTIVCNTIQHKTSQRNTKYSLSQYNGREDITIQKDCLAINSQANCSAANNRWISSGNIISTAHITDRVTLVGKADEVETTESHRKTYNWVFLNRLKHCGASMRQRTGSALVSPNRRQAITGDSRYIAATSHY